MNVSDVMTRGVETCTLNDSLSVAAQIMWDNDCGCVPVLDMLGNAVAMITDRDVCMAAYTQGLPLADISVMSASSHGLVTVREDDTLDSAEALMRAHRIRRVPVVDAAGAPIGILSLADLARSAGAAGHKPDGLSVETVARTLAAISQPGLDAERVAAGATN